MTSASTPTGHLPAGTTPGLVCAHHHLYSALARGLPGPARVPTTFREVLELLWWRLDVAIDLEDLAAGARLGALEALEAGCTAVIDHHESPSAIDGSLQVIAEACAEVGVRVLCAYGVTDRHGSIGRDAGLSENARHLSGCGHGLVGLHAAFTCGDDTIEAAAGLARDLGVGVHVHVAEGPDDDGQWERLRPHSTGDWLLVHGVRLPDDHGLAGTIVHNPRSNMNNAVGYARPGRFAGRVALGTDGIGADLLDEFRVAFARHREQDVTATADESWRWLAAGWELVPEALEDRVRWSVAATDPWSLAYTTGVRPVEVTVGGKVVLDRHGPTRVDPDLIRARAAESMVRLATRW